MFRTFYRLIVCIVWIWSFQQWVARECNAVPFIALSLLMMAERKVQMLEGE